MVRATNAEGAMWQWAHDRDGRVVAETDPLGHVRRVEYLDDESLSLRVYEPDARLYERHTSADERAVRVVSPGGASRTTQLNSCGWPVAIWDELGACTQLRWGTEPGELLEILDANGASYTFEYDADQRFVRRVTFDGRVLGTEWKKGRVVATVDAAGQRTELGYDGRGRVAEQVRVDGTTVLEYDARGFLTGLVSPEAVLRFERDAAGRNGAEDQDGVRVRRELDVMGRPLTYQSEYGVETQFGWSASGRCMSVLHGDAGVAFTRDAMGREVGRDLTGAGRFDQSYDPVSTRRGGATTVPSSATRHKTRTADRVSRRCDNQSGSGSRTKPAANLRVKRLETGLHTYADALVVCGPQFEDPRRTTLLNPRVNVEVRSEATEAYDRSEKFAHYRSLESLGDYVLRLDER